MTHQRPDPEIPQRRAADPAASVWVAASAGTGKTKVLTDRVLNLLLAGTDPARILCLTFTKAAAAEMSNRINARLATWATAPEPELAKDLARLQGEVPDADRLTGARRLFARVLDTPGGMRIETIHAFCQSLLRRFPLEASLAPHFAVMDDRDAAELMAAAQDEVLAAAREGADERLAAALADVTARVHETNFPDLMAALASDRGRLSRLLSAHGGLDGLVAALRDKLGAGDDSPDQIIAKACQDSAFDHAGCRAAVDALLGGSKTDQDRAALMAPWLADPAQRVELWKDYLSAFLTTTGTIRKTLCTKAIRDSFPTVENALNTEAERLLRVIDRWKAAQVAAATESLLRLGDALLTVYERHKDARALLDYDDLILTAGRLLDDRGVASWVLFKLDGGLDHVLIDEAQDTNPDQWAVVRALTAEFFAGRGVRETVRTVFAVGDAKQSIYSFQRADPRAFEEMRTLFARHVPEAGQTWDEVALQVSFRSTKAVLDAVDAVFNAMPGRDGVIPADLDLRHLPFREGQAGSVEIWPPVDPIDQDEPEPWKPPVERMPGDSSRSRLARLIAKRIHAMVGRETLESQNRPIKAGDVLVLVRRRGAFVEDLVRELKVRGVAVAGADRMVLTEQMAVMDLMALAACLLLPDDDLTLATVLKGPLIGLTEDQLFELAHGRQSSLWDALRKRAGQAPFDQAYAELHALLGMADYASPHNLFAHLLTARGGREKLVRRLGYEAEDPIDEFLNLTLAFERGHPPSLQGFLRWLESGTVEVKRDLEQGGVDAVRIMTVHGSKGLQAPIVFLPDTLQAPTKGAPLLWLDDGLVAWVPKSELLDPVSAVARDAAKQARAQEYRRLLYVALTRAEDRLVVCGWNTKKAAPEDCWYNLVRAAVAPLAEEVDDRFLAGQPEATGSRILRVTCPQTATVKDAERAANLAQLPMLPPWATEAPGPEPSPPRPLMPSRPDGEEPPVRSPLGHDDGARFKRGTLIHRLLQTLPDLPPDKRAAATARYLARPTWGLPFAMQAEIASEVADVLEHPQFAALFAPGSQAEVPVVGLIGERVVAGQVDRLAVTSEAVLIVDYKTNRPPPKDERDVPAVYLRQMAAYRAALACVYPGREIRCALLWTDVPRLMPLDNRRLDDALAGLA